MTLEKAISYAIDNEGINIITETRFLNYLTDLQAFEYPAQKKIVSSLIEEGYFDRISKVITTDNYEVEINDVEYRLVNSNGFQQDLVRHILDCLIYAVHKTGNIPMLPKQQSVKKTNEGKKESKLPFRVIQANGNFLVNFNGNDYELNEGQYNSILRKQNIPSDRLEVWLQSYVKHEN